MDGLIAGLEVVFSMQALLAIFIGTVIGLIIGALPGLNGNMAIALLLPITFNMDPAIGIILLASIYCASCYGGSFSAILLGIPGTVSSIVTVFDGYPMACSGNASRALIIATLSSAFGGIFSNAVLTIAAPQLAFQALKFGPAEYFALAVLGLSTLASVGSSPLRGLISGVFGLIIACVGMEPQTGFMRFTFRNINLMEGIPFIPALIGFFGVVSVLKIAESEQVQESKIELPKINKIFLEASLIKRLLPTWFRSAVLGTGIGILPGAGTSIATFLAYDYSRRTSKTPEAYGKGIEEGIAAPEAANNGVVGGSLVPMLALGVPGNSTAALMLGALMIHGLRPGPMLFKEQPAVAYSFLISMFLANIFMVPLGLYMSRYMSLILNIPVSLLGGLIMAFCTVGTYSIKNSVFDILIMAIFGVMGYIFEKVEIPTSPIILALVLGPMMESSLHQALIISGGSYSFLYNKPITLIIMLISIWSFCAPLLKAKKNKKLGEIVES